MLHRFKPLLRACGGACGGRVVARLGGERWSNSPTILIFTVLCWLTASAPLNAEEPAAAKRSAEGREFFEKQVRPLLAKRCFACHGGTKAGGGLSLASAGGWQQGGESGPAIVPGNPDQSLLIQGVDYDSLEMPPADKGGKLPVDEIAILTTWVAMGAPDPRDGGEVLGGMTRDAARNWWTFQPLPAASANAASADSGDEIDALLEREWETRGLTAWPRADKRTLIRRATYDLTGLPPTADEVQDFLADESPEAFTKVVNRLLDSPQYGVQWGRHWLDVVRFHATILHLMGFDHERLTYRHAGRDFRLTGVEAAQVVNEVLA